MVRISGKLVVMMMVLTAPVAVAQARPGGATPTGGVGLALEPVVRATESLELPMSSEPDELASWPDESPPSSIEVPLSQLWADTALPGLPQVGDVTNCGPTAAAMLLAAYDGARDEGELSALREALGYWSWDTFPLRQLSLPGYDAGMTTLGMLRATLDHFARDVAFEPVEHAWLPGELWSIVALKRAVVERRPLLTLVHSATLWNVRTAGLHWVVVRGIEGGTVIYNDPADGSRSEVPFDRFWRAWRLTEIYRSLPMVAAFQALAPDRAVPERSLMEDARGTFAPVAR